MGKLIVAALISVLAAGCNSQVGDYVAGGGDPLRSPDEPKTQGSGPMAMKISPGRVISSSPQVSMEATVTPTRRKLTGAQVSGEVTFGRTRVKYE